MITNTVIDPPFIGTVADQTTNENTPVTFTLSSTDPEKAGVAYTILSDTSDAAPTNVTVSIDQTTGQVTLTPAAGFTGTIALLAGVRATSAADKSPITTPTPSCSPSKCPARLRRSPGPMPSST